MPKFLDVTDTGLAMQKLGASSYSVTNYGATGNGTTDDTTAIHAARTAAGVGGKVFFPAGTYLVDGLTASVADQTWELHSGAIIKMKTGASEILEITGEGVTVTGGVFDGSNGTAHDWSQQGIRVTADGVTIRGATVQDGPKHGIYSLNVNRLRVSGCHLVDNWSNGVFVQNYDLVSPEETADIVIVDNLIESTQATAYGIGVRGETDAQRINRVTITGNTVRLPYGSATMAEVIVVFYGADYVVSNNVAIGGYLGISCAQGIRATIANNVVRGFKYVGIEIAEDMETVAVTGNSIDPDGVSSGSGIQHSNGTIQNVTISGNTIASFPTGTSNGINFSSGSIVEHGSICGNTITSSVASGQFNGIILYDCSNVTISGNSIDANSTATSYGMQIYGFVVGLTIVGNQFSNIAQRLINFASTDGADTVDHIYIAGNALYNCPASPLYLNTRAGAATNFTTDLAIQMASGTSPAKTVAVRDGNGNLTADAFMPALTSTATAAGTTTLTVTSTEVQRFTGSNTQTCVLPTTSVAAGQRFTVLNSSTGAVTVNASGGATVAVLAAGGCGEFTALQATPTTAAHWAYGLTSPTLVTPVLGTPASGTLTNCTGLPLSGLTASTSTALGLGSVELGHASDTTVSRSAAGVAAVEGNPVSVRVTVPGTSTTAGKPGYWAADASYIYTYTGDGSTHAWVRATAASW